MSELAGRTAIVTGGVTKIGQGVVIALRDAGATVVVADIDPDGAAKLKPLGDGIHFTHTDITDDAALSRLIGGAVSDHGGIDILVNLACTYTDDGAGSGREPTGWKLSTSTWSAPSASKAADRTSGLETRIHRSSSISVPSPRPDVALSGQAALVQVPEHGCRLCCRRYPGEFGQPGWIWSNIMDTLSHGNLDKTDAVARSFRPQSWPAREVGDVLPSLPVTRASFVTGADWAVDGGYSALGRNAPETIPPARR
jgi:NAD(P)-dependent dehydrogenase (short-subunit alcohol dehydrogenase family)